MNAHISIHYQSLLPGGVRMLPREDDTARVQVEATAANQVERSGPKSEGVLTVLRGPNPGFLYTLDASEAVIGRSPEVTVSIADEALSRRHARIRRESSAFYIEDLGSTNGTFVDGERLQRPRKLEDGCRISLGGRTLLRFALHDAVEQEAARSTHELTVRDPLTRVFNRGHLEERLASETAYAARHNTALAMLLIDVDDFKQVNDSHGHAAGDAALRVLARALTAMVRKEDVLARYGGEEFAIVARGIDRAGAIAFAERVRSGVHEVSVPTERKPLRVTVSVGVAHTNGGEGCEGDRLLRAADRALYTAKRAGRNRVEAAPFERALKSRRLTPRRSTN
ncbi:MAG TPA: GGDEF domain-containing protein [Polyangiales bacterium]